MKKVISTCLFVAETGYNPHEGKQKKQNGHKYIAGVLHNISARDKWFPDWEFVIVYDETIPQEYTSALQEFPAVTCIEYRDPRMYTLTKDNKEKHTGLSMTLSRYTIVDHPSFRDADVILFRDVDTQLTAHDAKEINLWLGGGDKDGDGGDKEKEEEEEKEKSGARASESEAASAREPIGSREKEESGGRASAREAVHRYILCPGADSKMDIKHKDEKRDFPLLGGAFGIRPKLLAKRGIFLTRNLDTFLTEEHKRSPSFQYGVDQYFLEEEFWPQLVKSKIHITTCRLCRSPSTDHADIKNWDDYFFFGKGCLPKAKNFKAWFKKKCNSMLGSRGK